MKTKSLIMLGLLLVLLLSACSGSDSKAEPASMDASKSMEEPKMMDDSGTMKDSEMADASTMDDSTMAKADMDSPQPMDDTTTAEPNMDGAQVMDDTQVMDDKTMDAPEMETGLTLSFGGLEDLGPGWVYEGWLVVDGQPYSSGRFTVNAQGSPNADAFAVEPMLLTKASAFVLTIEPDPDPDPGPSAAHLLGGDFMGDAAELSVAHPAALGNDLTGAGGSYILGIPTSDSADDAYQSGIWFTALELPALPEGWIYEGWVVGPDGPMSTGRFNGIEEKDSDGAGPAAGPKAGPAIPGQDYLNPPIDLTSDYAAVISIEPEPDNSPAPFALKPLGDTNIEDVGDHVPQAIENQASAVPAGKAMRQAAESAEMAKDAGMMEETPAGPDWFYVSLTDVDSGESFTVGDLHGKVVLVETLATWCPKCLSQQKEVKALHEMLGERSDLVSIGLSIDPNEDAKFLQAYADKNGFDWLYAIAPTEVAREIGQLYGDQFLNPPSTPMLIVDRQGQVHPLPFGIKEASKLQEQVEMYLNEGS